MDLVDMRFLILELDVAGYLKLTHLELHRMRRMETSPPIKIAV